MVEPGRMAQACVLPMVSFRDLIVVHPDIKRKLHVLSLIIYDLVIFSKALRHIDEAVVDLFDRLDKRVTPILGVLTETFRSLSAFRRAGEGRFDGCVQLFLVWLHGLFWKVDKVSYRVFSEDYSLLKEVAAMPMRDDISEERWMAILQNLQEEDVEWRAPWMVPDEILYQCGSFDWVPLPEIWGAVGYAHLLTRQMKRLVVGSMTTPEYKGWLNKRINDNIPGPSLKGVRSTEEYLQLIPSKLEIIKHDFEKRNSE
ncbi:hypothetical protein CXB51_002700 [Gossypium anomalum]|uniref:DUF7745 domain-containing protein n=1 Tax=Gossypium anomalum TaxID=47600 RepID=A0A8J5Z185_9ROSI|nr:hypothetical protein CXB51_002700 [Gossypium anomalum]